MYKRICLYTTPYAFMQSLTSGVAACARRVGSWQIDIAFPSESGGAEHLFDGRYEGVIIGYPFGSIPASLRTTRSKVVFAACSIPEVPAIVHDNLEIGEMAAEHLIECGYRRFAYFGVDVDWSIDRYQGFKKSLAKHGHECVSNTTADGRFPNWNSSLQVARCDKFLQQLQKPVAVFSCYDGLARLLVDRAVELGLRVPGDMAVLGVDNDELRCETGTVPLTSIDTNLFRIGHEAGLLLDRLMRGELPRQSRVQIAPKAIVRRQSTSMAAHSDPDIAASMRFIYERACDGISVEDVCNHVAMSRRRLEIRFRSAVGRTPGDEIRAVRVERAKALLTDTDLTIVEIAVRCGYSHISGFSSAFRRLVGVLPSAYRQQTPG